MNTKIPLTIALLRLLRDFGIILLIAQMMYGCELEEIPPTFLKTRSSFQFLIQDTECTSNCVVVFTNASENADRFEWSFGDESAISTLADPSHTYALPGSYDVNLRAFRDSTEHDTTITVVINDAEPDPVTNLHAFVHTANADNTSLQITTFDNALTNNNASKIIVVTPVLGTRNTAALGVYYFGNKWRIFTQNTSNIQIGETFNVVVSDPDASAFVHQTSAATLRTSYRSAIDHPATNNKPNARVFVTPVWEKSTDYTNHPVGVVYMNDRWQIVNLDKADLPTGLKFNVIVSTDDSRSFFHTSEFSTISVDYTMVDDSKTNAKPDAKVIVTSNQGTNDALFVNPYVTGIWYRSFSSQWTIFNEANQEMPTGASFNILAIE